MSTKTREGTVLNISKATRTKSDGSKSRRKKTGTTKTIVTPTNVKFIVAPKSNGWTVKRVGSDKLREFDTQADAIAAATKTARNTHAEVVILRKDGTVRDKVSTAAVDSAMLKVWRSIHRDISSAKKR